jgi:hypothetical protein
MDDTEQQIRLLIYTAVLAATNSLLFDAAKKKNIGWRAVPFEVMASPPNV